MKKWYSPALESLRKVLREKKRINGLDFLQDYVLDNRENYFQELEFEDVDQFVTDQFDDFQSWLTAQAGVRVLANGKWVEPGSAADSSGSGFDPSHGTSEKSAISSDDAALLDLEVFNISPSHFESFKTLYAKLAATNLSEAKYKCAFRLAKCGEIKNDVPDYELINFWIYASDAAAEAGFKDNACDCLSEAAYHYQRISKFREAAEYFEKAAQVLADSDSKRKRQILKNARAQYQMIGDHDSATKVFLEEKELEAKAAKRSLKFALFIYWLTSNYGESPGRVALNVLGVWVLSVIVFSLFLVSEDLSQGFLGRLLDCIYYSVVTFTTLGYGDITPENAFGKIASGALAILGLLYTSLFMVTVVRRYGRD